MDGKKADFAEGSMFGTTKRYLAYTRKVPSALRVSVLLYVSVHKALFRCHVTGLV